jgi:hypothetical protein
MLVVDLVSRADFARADSFSAVSNAFPDPSHLHSIPRLGHAAWAGGRDVDVFAFLPALIGNPEFSW